MYLLAMSWTWGEVTTVITGACIAIPVITAAILKLALNLITQVRELKGAIKTLSEQSEKHGEEIKANAASIVDVATLSTPAVVTDKLEEIKQKIDGLKP